MSDERPRVARARTTTLAAIAAGALATLLVTILPFVRFAYKNPSLHVMLDTIEAAVALLAAYLLYGRFRQTRRRADLVLVYALTLLGMTNLLLSALPRVALGSSPEEFATWTSLTGRTAGALALAVAALMNEGRVTQRHRYLGTRTLVLASLTLVAIGLAAVAASGYLPATGTATFPTDASRPILSDQPAVAAFQLLSFLLYMAAAWGFTRRAEGRGDEVMQWFAAGAALSAFARVNYFLFPSLYTNFVYTGDLLRVSFYLLLLMGVTREVRGYWRELAVAAVMGERRRIARDLHDGLAQELAFISARAHQVAGRTASEDALQIERAAHRALDESRRAIAALSELGDEPLGRLLTQTAEDVAARLGARVRVDLDPQFELPEDHKEALVRIVREAITNAVRHGDAQLIEVTFVNGSVRKLVIRDDGRGFDLEDARRGPGFGLTSMEERARAFGGRLKINSHPGEGTALEVALP